MGARVQVGAVGLVGFGALVIRAGAETNTKCWMGGGGVGKIFVLHLRSTGIVVFTFCHGAVLIQIFPPLLGLWLSHLIFLTIRWGSQKADRVLVSGLALSLIGSTD
ncbi:hypothetical protein HOY82DRAFT_558415 [Tuber indicum]|nr:hypothetical protein HOY82DRAFT_558415 [Tuber indicum]